jgi:hypothetical protein
LEASASTIVWELNSLHGRAEIVAAMRPLSSSPRQGKKQIIDHTPEPTNVRNEKHKMTKAGTQEKLSQIAHEEMKAINMK